MKLLQFYNNSQLHFCVFLATTMTGMQTWIFKVHMPWSWSGLVLFRALTTLTVSVMMWYWLLWSCLRHDYSSNAAGSGRICLVFRSYRDPESGPRGSSACVLHKFKALKQAWQPLAGVCEYWSGPVCGHGVFTAGESKSVMCPGLGHRVCIRWRRFPMFCHLDFKLYSPTHGTGARLKSQEYNQR